MRRDVEVESVLDDQDAPYLSLTARAFTNSDERLGRVAIYIESWLRDDVCAYGRRLPSEPR